MIKLLKVLLIPLVLCLVLLLAITSVYQWLYAPGVLHVKKAQFMVSDSMLPPDFLSSEVEQRLLPDNWLRSMRGFGGSGWYEVHIPKQEQQGHVWGVFIPRANMNVALFLNHHEIGNSGHFSEPVSRNWARPLYYNIPAGFLSENDNVMHIHLKSYADEAGGLSELLIGEQDALLPLYKTRNFVQIDLAKITFFMNIFAGLLALFLWRLRRFEPMYAWFSVICFSSSFFILNTFLLEIPIGRNAWHFLVYVAIGWFACSLLMFTLHFIKKNKPVWERYLLIYMLISSLVVLGLQNIFVAMFWHIGSLMMVSYACIVLFRSWLSSGEAAELVLFIALLFTFGLGFHDWYTRLTLQQFGSPVLMHLGPPLMLLAISWILIVRFVKSMQANESFNIELQLRIQEARSELNQEHQRVQVLLQQEAKLGERNRIMKDLHDGLGSYLMSAHSIARIKQLDDGIQQALNDALFWLKTSIDTLDSEDSDLASLLGTFRYRVEPQLKSCGIILDWQMDDLSKYQLPSEQHLHVVRIMQEAVTNVIKHAKASCLSIHVKSLEDQHVCLSIEDNGCGISGEQVGHGLKNMRERIEMIGGSMHMDEAVSGGVLLKFTLPA